MSATLHGPEATTRNRALRLELIVQRPLLWGSGAVALVVLLAAIGQFAQLGIVPILLAVAVPVAAAPRDSARDDWLRGTLGISRAAHVRARVRVVMLSQLGLLLIAALVILLGPHSGEEHPAMLGRMRMGGLSLLAPTVEYWQDLAIWAPAVLWSHIWVGRDALRNSSTLMWARALISYLGMYIVVMAAGYGAWLLVLLLGALLGLESVVGPAAGAISVLTGAALLGGGLLVLRWRSRVWARAA